MKVRHLGVVALFLLLGCAESRPKRMRFRMPEQALPAFVTVRIDNAIVGPSKADGRAWDGPGSVPPHALQALGGMMRSGHPLTVAASVGGVAASLAGSGAEPPEPFGSAEIFVGGKSWGAQALDRAGQRDTCTPAWNGPPTWFHVPIAPAVRLIGELLDRDFFGYHDPMGRFSISYEYLLEALRAQRVYPVPVDDQTAGQVLFVGIEVWPE